MKTVNGQFNDAIVYTDNIEEKAYQQIQELCNQEFVKESRIRIMPDTHAGAGCTIGTTMTIKDKIVPNLVGVDIGCGMAFVGTDIKVAEIREVMTGSGSLLQSIVGDILRNVPVGFNHHKKIQSCTTLDVALKNMDKYEANPALVEQIDAGFYQIGTLGGGNHFIELQEDNEGYLGIMIHSGSRNFGKQVCDFFHNIARELNQKWYSSVPDEWRLAFLPVDISEGKQYINWMNLALDFAAENRTKMMYAVRSIIEKWIGKHTNISFNYTDEINCHHNYAAIEHHYDKNVWVHRKGATRARLGEIAVIPGAMGSYSYVVEGLGNEMSFCSSSHGAGRQYSRKGAMQNFSTEQVMVDLKEQGVILGKHNKEDVAEESRFAYKDIDVVMENQQDLVKPIKKLKTIGVVKG
jgi:tRNA-splicing ligase RtcB